MTAAYIAKNPPEARHFAEDDAFKKWKLCGQKAMSTPPCFVTAFEAGRILGQRVGRIVSRGFPDWVWTSGASSSRSNPCK